MCSIIIGDNMMMQLAVAVVFIFIIIIRHCIAKNVNDERCAPSFAFHPEHHVPTGCAPLRPFVVSTGRLRANDHVEYRQVRVSGDRVVGRDAGRNLCCFALHARRAPVPRAIDAPSFHTLCLMPSVVLLLVNHLEL